MPSRKSFKSRGLSTKDWQGIAMMVLVGCIALGLLGAFGYQSLTGDKVDSETFCSTEKIPGHTLVIVDHTDPLTPSQLRSLRAQIDEIRANLKGGEKISIYALDSEEMKGLSIPLFALCNPGDGRNANELYENPTLIRRRYDAKFGQPLNAAIEQLATGSSASRSPIMEALFDVVLLPDFRHSQPGRRLVIFSDLMQHSEGWSQYRNAQTFKAFRATDYAQRMMPNLADINVDIYYLLRTDPASMRIQNNAHIAFWGAFFDETAANLTKIEKVR